MTKITFSPADRSTRKFSDMGEPTGFVNRTDSTLTWSDSTPDRTLTIAPAVTSFDYYIAGKRYTKSASETIQIGTAEGLHIIYYDGVALTTIANPTDAQEETVILTKAWVAYIYWDATNNLGELLEERHGITMDGDTHRELHFTAGTTYFDGLALGDILADQDGSSDTHAQFSVATGQIFDEDIKHITNTIGSTTGLEVWYRNASLDWRKDTQAGFSVLNATAGRVYYDNAGTLTEVTDGKWVLYHVFAWNAEDANPIAIMGQAEYSTRKAAREGATTEINSLLLGILPSPEMKAIATVIFQTKDTYTNSVKARIVTTDEGDDYVDWRTAKISPSAAAQDHGSLAGLTDDDHSQYVLHSLADAANDFLVASGADIFVKKTLAETGAILETDIDHDNLVGFVGNKHIDHTAVDLVAGVGLSGGGDISANRTFTLDLNELTTETVIASGDFIAMVDITDSGSGKITFANLEGAIDHGNLTGLATGADHSYIDQDVTVAATPTFNGLNAGDANITNVGDIALDSITAEDATGPIVINDDIRIIDGEKLFLGTGDDGQIYASSDDLYIENVTQDKDIIFRVNSGGATTTMARIDGSTAKFGVGEFSASVPSECFHLKDAGTVKLRIESTDLIPALDYAEPSHLWNTFSYLGDLTYAYYGSGATVLHLDGPTERVGIGIAAGSGSGKLHIDQSSTTDAIPVLLLDQADVSEEFIRFIGTAASGVLTQSIVDEGDQGSQTLEGWVKVYVQDDGDQITDQAYFIPIYTLSA